MGGIVFFKVDRRGKRIHTAGRDVESYREREKEAERCITAGKRAAKMYRAQHGAPLPKHDQTVRGLVVPVNSYTERDRGVLEAAIWETPR